MKSFELATAIALAYDENGMLGVQTDAHGENVAGHGRYHVGSFGLIGRPLPANGSGGAITLISDEGKEGFAWVGFDARDLTKAPPLTDGSVALYNSAGQFLGLDYKEETGTWYVPVGSGAHVLTIGKTGSGKKIIDLLHVNGSHFTLGEDDTVWRGNGNAYLQIKGDNITANGTFKSGSGDFGGGAGLPVTNAVALAAAVSAMASAAAMTGGSPVTGAALAALLNTLAAAISSTCSTTRLTAI
jgi:hypothetical protein